MQTDEPTDTTNESCFTQFCERAHDDISFPPPWASGIIQRILKAHTKLLFAAQSRIFPKFEEKKHYCSLTKETPCTWSIFRHKSLITVTTKEHRHQIHLKYERKYRKHRWHEQQSIRWTYLQKNTTTNFLAYIDILQTLASHHICGSDFYGGNWKCHAV